MQVVAHRSALFFSFRNAMRTQITKYWRQKLGRCRSSSGVTIAFVIIALCFAIDARAQEAPANSQPNRYGKGWVCKHGFANNSGKCVAVDIPANAQLNYLGSGWVCKRGFANNGGKCVAVDIPANAQLNYLGSGWVCKHGFANNSGKCVAVEIPANAQLNYLGSGWVCKRGFANNGGKCVAVDIPANAQLNYLGSGWVCKHGFANNSGKCLAIKIPENGQINALGNGWDCSFGFKKAENSCQQMTASELVEYRKRLIEMRSRQRRLAGRGDTYTTDKGAEFTITVDDVSLNCKDGFDGGFDRCSVEISYSLSTDYNGNNTPSVGIRCEADISYTDKSGWGGTKSEDDSKTEDMSGSSESGEMELDFSFSFEEAKSVRVTDSGCEIESVD